jgi:hypothetical protein
MHSSNSKLFPVFDAESNNGPEFCLALGPDAKIHPYHLFHDRLRRVPIHTLPNGLAIILFLLPLFALLLASREPPPTDARTMRGRAVGLRAGRRLERLQEFPPLLLGIRGESESARRFLPVGVLADRVGAVADLHTQQTVRLAGDAPAPIARLSAGEEGRGARGPLGVRVREGGVRREGRGRGRRRVHDELEKVVDGFFARARLG